MAALDCKSRSRKEASGVRLPPCPPYQPGGTMEQRDYQLIVRIPVKALDDPGARMKAHEILNKMGVPENTVVKLQRLEEKAEPTGIKI